MAAAGGLAIEGLVAGYGGGVVIDGMSRYVAPGRTIALLGRNGVGQPTLLRTILGLIRPSAGTITFAGNLPGHTQTLPLFVYVKLESGDTDAAIVLSLVLLLVSLAVLVGLRDRWLGLDR